jgi:hypothetical protein
MSLGKGQNISPLHVVQSGSGIHLASHQKSTGVASPLVLKLWVKLGVKIFLRSRIQVYRDSVPHTYSKTSVFSVKHKENFKYFYIE